MMLAAVLSSIPSSRLAIHCHDTHGRALSNIRVALENGIRVVDASVSGLGGCPYAGEGVAGNVATEHVLEALEEWGYQTNVDLEAIREISKWISTQLDRSPPESHCNPVAKL